MNENLDTLVKSLMTMNILRREETIKAFLKVDRKFFVQKGYENQAYLDIPLPISKDSTISAPHMHAIYLEELELKEGDKFLEIGFGSGILLAYAYEITKREVYGVEIEKEVFEFGKKNLEKTGYIDKCKIFLRDGKLGLKEYAPFDKIAVSAATRRLYKSWIEQLRNGGIMLVPIIEGSSQKLYKVIKRGDRIEKKTISDVIFVEIK